MRINNNPLLSCPAQVHASATPPCGHALLRQITGNTLRPGGLELTIRALDLCSFAPSARLLDIGCGPGASLGFFRDCGFKAVGLDISLSILSEAYAHGPALVADFHYLPLRDACLDGIFCECALSLAENKVAVLAECHRILRPEAKLVVSDLVVLQEESKQKRPDSLFPCAQGAIPLAELGLLLENSGFTLLSVEDHTRLLRDLAARIVFHFGSLHAFSCLWKKTAARAPHTNKAEACAPEQQLCTPTKKSGYALLVAAKNKVDPPG